jgi:adenylosuccinate synthase
MIEYADVIVDLQHGDTGKGKVTSALCKKNHYTHVIRYNGGNNAGHTIYVDGKKIVTHSIPSGVLHGIKSIIGPGCVVNPEHFLKELEEIRSAGINVEGLVFIAKNAHVITEEHLEEDGKDTKIGTTRRGVGPAYVAKYARSGIRAEQVEILKPYLIDMYEELHSPKTHCKILFEGAQGFGLDIDWGDYPYVTSSGCTVGSAISNGVPPQAIRHVYGIAKAYETYVGAKKFEPEQDIFKEIRELGQEYGATTGRARQCNWINIKQLIKAANINGVTCLVINKFDILKQTGQFSLHIDEGTTLHLKDEISFKNNIYENMLDKTQVKQIIWSESPSEL